MSGDCFDMFFEIVEVYFMDGVVVGSNCGREESGTVGNVFDVFDK